MSLRYPRIPKDRTIWCGPFIVGLLLGLDYVEAYKILLADVRQAAAEVVRAAADQRYEVAGGDEVRRSQPARITGTYPHQIARLLNKRGVRCDFTELEERQTLLSFIRHVAEPGKTYLIDAGHHWLVVRNGVMYQSHYRPTVLERAPTHRKARVLCWAEVVPIGLA